MKNLIDKLTHPSSCWKLSKQKLILATLLLTCSAVTQAGKIISTDSTVAAKGFGGWNLENIEITLDGIQGEIDELMTSWFDESTGSYNFAVDSDYSYQGAVFDDVAGTTVMGYAQAKDWPVGEPSGIKIVNDDFDVKEGRPTNCIMSTSYLDDHFLDSTEPLQVLCSGPFQSHKRYKLAMLPTTIDGGNSDSLDLVFNVESEIGSRDYQIFQKINNWTDSRLEGFTIEVGFGIGTGFELASQTEGVGVINLSLAVPESVWSAKQLATFSAGLFGPIDDKHDRPAGYFDPLERAGYFIDEYPVESGITDSLHSSTTLGSDYNDVPAGANIAANQFGNWIPNSMLPYGIFFDDDADPATDNELKYWYGYNSDVGGLAWMTGAPDFLAIDDYVITSKAGDLLYSMAPIDDLVNIGLNYIVTVGDVSSFPDSRFTIRITPTQDTSGQGKPMYVDQLPVPSLGFTSSDSFVSITPESTFAIGTSLIARVADADLTTTVDVLISTDDSSVADQTLTLTEENEGRAVFIATVPEQFSNVALGYSVTLTYTDADIGDGTPATKTATTLATANESFGIIQFTSASYNVGEEDNTATITVTRVGNTDNEVSVEFSTQYNSAVGNEDYEAITGNLKFASGVTSQIITVNLLDDVLHEDNEAFNVILSNVQGGAVLGGVNNAEVTISDNDPIIVQLSRTEYIVVEGGVSALLTVERNGGFETANVDYSTSDGTAIAGTDYTAVNGTFKFSDGETSKVIQVAVIDDWIQEGDETFTFSLSNSSTGVVLGEKGVMVITIMDDDLGFNTLTTSESGGGGAINPLLLIMLVMLRFLSSGMVNRRVLLVV